VSTTWTFPAFVDQLAAAIVALPVITAMNPTPEVRVNVPSESEDISDLILFGYEVGDIKEKVSLGTTTEDEEVSVQCLARAVRYGSGEVVAKEARDRVVAYVAIVDEYLRENEVMVGVQTMRQLVTDREYAALPGMVGDDKPARFAVIIFDIDYRARTV